MNFTSFDNTVSITTLYQKPDSVRMLKEETVQIARGAGLSYTPASFGQNILVRDFRQFNRILEFDAKLKTVIVESGITLKKLLEWSFKEKLFFPIMPGFPEITIGGCIAANVHGKNPLKDGTCKDHLIWLELYHPKTGFQKTKSNSEIFNATCGGLGLTGIITKVKLQLYHLPSDRIKIVPKKVDSLKDAIQIIQENKDADIVYSWHNGSTSMNFEKGIVRVGTFEEGYDIGEKIFPKKTVKLRKTKFPKSFWGGTKTSIINSLARNIELKKGPNIKNIYEGFFPFTQNAKSYYFLYGKNGFRAYQVLISNEYVSEFIDDLIQLIKKYSADITIIGIKPFRGEQKFLQFCRNGVSIILEMKNSQSNTNFLAKLD
ncbi:MAG: hypothetical protein CXT78_08910, partial [Thaumarchaeota archaeon]